MWKALNGDLGQSLLGNRPAITPLLRRVSLISAQLGLCSFLMVIILGVGLGILAGLTQNSPTDYAIVTTLTTLAAVPVFVLAPVLMVVFTLVLHVIPDPIGWDGLFSAKIILPVASIVLPNLVGICRLTRNGILDVLPSDYVRTARAKGLGSLRVMLRHVLPNALTPVLTVSGPLFGNLLLGSLFVEYIFAIPGFGNLGFNAFVSLDYPVIVSQTIISATLAMLLILVVDLLYGVLDPRVRLVVPGRLGR
jgi:oligopeptide transport system permease protein